jgi:hypothetical protein
MSRQKEHGCGDCDADENDHRKNTFEQRSWERRKRSGLSLRRHRRIEHSNSGDFSRWEAAAGRRGLGFGLTVSVGEFVRHNSQCYSHCQNLVQHHKLRARNDEGLRLTAATAVIFR